MTQVQSILAGNMPEDIEKGGSNVIGEEDFKFIARIDIPDHRARDAVVRENPMQLAKTFVNLLNLISKDQTIQYLLTLLDDLLQDDKSRVDLFKQYAASRNESVWVHFLNLLNRPMGFIMNMTSRIIAKMACWSRELMAGSDLQFYLTWLKDQLRAPGNEYIQSVARCLQMMLRIDDYRKAFVHLDGISTVVSVLSGRVNFQIQYQLSFCLWVLTFNADIAEKLHKFGVIPILADILTDAQKEKVSRIILAVFRYVTEVHSGRLEWSPVHRSEKFWRENAHRLNDKNYELLKMLIHLLETTKDPLVLSVASFDLGEYVRHYSRGKHVLELLGGKTIVMSLLAHEDPNVRYEALLAVQKLMVHNWEYLGRQLEKEQVKKGTPLPIKAS
ncbi:hypothetical protein TCAL_11458 [Tigriopus californicus]|uniref:Armadillo repeat-containing domain-containing protein n=1 Tax=Tigriopus californicus TaxID=6832 RepID=A0A553P3W6_TIGCA|nr:hypothetical protein TCAL_11458 [Tigriopus californicus]